MKNKKASSNNINLEELARNLGIKIERISALMEILERGLEEEYEIEQKKLTSISYIISDYISELKEEFEIFETKIVESEFND